MALVLLMGIPGSGKTSLCRKLKEQMGEENCSTFSFDDIFNDDGFMEHLWGKEYANVSLLRVYGVNGDDTGGGISAHSERKRCEIKVRDFLKSQLFTDDGKSNTPSITVVDDIFYLKSMRRPFRRMSNLFHLPYLIVLVDVPLATALLRNAQRPEKYRIPESTIRKIHQQMELPTGDDGNFFVYRTADDLKSLTEYIGRIRRKTRHFRECCSGSIQKGISENAALVASKKDGHLSKNEEWMQLELHLRKCLSELIHEKNVTKDGALLAKIKRTLYSEMRAKGTVIRDISRLKDLLWQRFQKYNCSEH